MKIDLSNKTALVCGVANERSLAYAIAKILHLCGARLILTYQGGDSLKRRVAPLAKELGQAEVIECDVNSDQSLLNLKSELSKLTNKVDVLIHSIAFAPETALSVGFIQTTRADFNLAMNSSVYSLIALSQSVEDLLGQNSCILTLTNDGSNRVIPQYNIMGIAKAALESSVKYLASELGQKKIRVNAISAGPVKTLAAMGIPHFRSMLEMVEAKSPLRENISAHDVGNLAAFLVSPLASHITGSVYYLDSGTHILGI